MPLTLAENFFVPFVAVWPHLETDAVTVSSSGTIIFSRDTSLYVMPHSRPSLKPLYGFVVIPGATIVVLVANPSKFLDRICLRPFPPPIRKRSMKMPQNTPNPVRKLLLLLRVRESAISLYVAKSNLIVRSVLQ